MLLELAIWASCLGAKETLAKQAKLAAGTGHNEG